MDEQLIQLLADTQSSAEAPRKAAEEQLLSFYSNEAFPLGLASIASHAAVAVPLRQAALFALKNFVLAGWSSDFNEFKGQILVGPETKARLRESLLALATGDAVERKVQNAAALVVSKIASADFPDDWSGLLPHLLRLIPQATDAQLHGALKVLGELVDDSLDDEQFFNVAQDLVAVLYSVVVQEERRPSLRALAVSVFRGCIDSVGVVFEQHKQQTTAFVTSTMEHWMPLFFGVLDSKLQLPPPEDNDAGEGSALDLYRGFVALKLQVVKVLMKVRLVIPSVLTPHSQRLFQAIWAELSLILPTYQSTYIDDEQESRLEDSDGLPYTLDFLALEDLDFFQTCLRAPPVRKELEQQLQAQSTAGEAKTWITDVVQLAVAYAQITTEEEAMWQFDVNVLLSEETSMTANYTARTACGDLVIKLGEWFRPHTLEAISSYLKGLLEANSTWQLKEAALYALQQILADRADVGGHLDPILSNTLAELTRYSIQQTEPLLRARGYLAASNLVKVSIPSFHQTAITLCESTIKAVVDDEAEVVQVCCIQALQQYVSGLSKDAIAPLQGSILSALSHYLTTKDHEELAESDDLMITLIETLQPTILLDPRVCITGDGLNLLLTVASQSARNYQTQNAVPSTFKAICDSFMVLGGDAFTQLCHKALPQISGAFNVGNLTEDDPLSVLAAELLVGLTQCGTTPLPSGYVGAVLPKLQRILLESQDDELVVPSTQVVRLMLEKDSDQVFAWHDDSGKGGLEVVLILVDRLLNPAVDDFVAGEVGSMAAELIVRAGFERLGQYLTPLLQAAAIRLSTANGDALIQSLSSVFARLSITNPREVIDFLNGLQIGNEFALKVIIDKWLENSVNFVGWEDIRTNSVALTKLYDLHDPRLAHIIVKGDLIVTESNRIKTRSQSRNNPDTYTMISAPLKIIKILISDLSFASAGALGDLTGASAAIAGADADDDDAEADDADDADEWEDDPDTLDLGLGTSKQELMAFAEETPASAARQRDVETQALLTQFFRTAGAQQGFEEVFNALTPAEQEVLRMIG